jgi:lincosamide nucleotidyltransferase A/C/D/E
VDALTGHQTREHKDLDVLLPLDVLPVAMSLLAEVGFVLAYTWPESREVPGRHPLLGEPLPSAFVLTHADGREIDVHVYDRTADEVIILWDTARMLTLDDLGATGTVAGVPVRCMTAAMQITCHEGYDLPPAHADDVRLLQAQIQHMREEQVPLVARDVKPCRHAMARR